MPTTRTNFSVYLNQDELRKLEQARNALREKLRVGVSKAQTFRYALERLREDLQGHAQSKS